MRGPTGAQRDEGADVLDDQVRAAERAAGDERTLDADARRGHAQPLGERAAHAERGLRGGADDEPLVLVEPGEDDRHLERGGRREGERPLALDDRLGRSQRLVHVAFGHGSAGRDARVVLRGSLRVERGRQRLELELDELQRAARDLGLLGRRDREAVTDVMDDVGKHLRRVGERQHLDEPRHRARGGRVRADHARVRARRAAQREMQRPGLRVVAGERGLAGGAAHAHGRSGATWAITAATGPA